MAAPTVTAGPASDPPAPSRRRTRLDSLARLVVAASAGVLLYASFPPRTLWWLAPLAFVLLGAVLRGRRAWAGFLLGFVFGLGFLLPLLHWTGGYVGALPWIALSVAEALFMGAAAAGMARVSTLPAGPLWAAAVWIAGEAVRSRVPFGGFPWGRIGFGQADSPLLPVASVGGVEILGFVTVLAGLAIAETARLLAEHRRSAVWSAVLLVVAIASGPLSMLVPVSSSGPSSTTVVAAIQGNVPRLGLDFNSQRRAVLDNHVSVTEQLAADVATGRQPQPDIVIWPENSSDIDPLRNPDAADRIDQAATAIKAPILVGAVLVNPDGTTTSNSALVWEAGAGVVERTDKRRVMPFGEYMPWRSFFRLFSSYVDRAGNFVPGPGAGVVDMAGVQVGVAICWEIAFDDLVDDSVDAGATMLAVPSNNATFGLSEMTYQQMAMSRVRAVEHDRSVIVATTSGVSATISPDGTVTARTGQFVPGVLVDRTVLEHTTTLATRLRSAPEWVLTAVGVLAIAAAVIRSRRARTATGGPHDVAPAAREDGHG
ncbi:apolipoprotein N-acyltransferase [Pseudonocardia sp. N23]|uniref:apolipoprotein N-acyltransferase n=1 Tax=Pseudonocardia sp. N23 TaxID=1987376 RepID=UPI000BFDAB06|nr:apolipoprotein N-acyltransferase [Pseudonocardia sp. N23]GAY10745.1 apolipoprotein N-acyltransferase in lipid-linked oligosaccharide synthesis cluster [Pseudonocardia sp. N23]